jgi:hypothetical protein
LISFFSLNQMSIGKSINQTFYDSLSCVLLFLQNENDSVGWFHCWCLFSQDGSISFGVLQVMHKNSTWRTIVLFFQIQQSLREGSILMEWWSGCQRISCAPSPFYGDVVYSVVHFHRLLPLSLLGLVPPRALIPCLFVPLTPHWWLPAVHAMLFCVLWRNVHVWLLCLILNLRRTSRGFCFLLKTVLAWDSVILFMNQVFLEI